MSNREKMETLAEELKTMYLTENPVNFNDEDYGYKYFICFHNTHRIIARSKNITDMIDIIKDIIKNGAYVEGCTFY